MFSPALNGLLVKYANLGALIFILIVFFASEVSAITIADGCAVPREQLGRRAFYVDPLKGSMSNDGSAERPWSSLAEVLDSNRKLVAAQAYSANYEKGDQKLYEQNPSAPIKAGDVIYLKSGDHGNVEIVGATNKEFIIVQRAPGQTPTLRSLRINGASKWMFVGLKVQGAGDGSTSSSPGLTLVTLGRSSSRGPTENIVFADGSVSTTDDTSSWTDRDWVTKPFIGGLTSFKATCVTVTGNHFFNLRNAVGINGDRSLVANNKIDNFGNDAINIVASNSIIRNNTITDGRHTKSEQMHPDGIQGWTANGATNRNVVIDGNIIIKHGDPKISDMQGISIFDGKWDGLTISNNVVVTNHWHGIAIYGVTNTKILNNTVVASDPANRPTWIMVSKAKDGTSSRNVIIRNNITPQLIFSGENIVADHNIIAKIINATIAGEKIYLTKGRDPSGNIVDPNIYDTLVAVDNLNGVYDLRMKRASPAIGSGSSDQAPLTDITGKHRVAPIDIGAYRN